LDGIVCAIDIERAIVLDIYWEKKRFFFLAKCGNRTNDLWMETNTQTTEPFSDVVKYKVLINHQVEKNSH
jgi:uncharacterized protein (UPF0303 family)